MVYIFAVEARTACTGTKKIGARVMLMLATPAAVTTVGGCLLDGDGDVLKLEMLTNGAH